MEGFEYVVRKEQKQKICFGSGCSREILSRKSMTPIMRQYISEEYPDIAPWTYNAAESFKNINTKPCLKSISKRGYSGLARYGISLKSSDEYPAPCSYNISETLTTKIKESKCHFNLGSARKIFIVNKNPGPGAYVHKPRQGIIFEHNFGGRAKMCLAVEIKCCDRNTDVCSVCGDKPLGDYWHWNNKVFLCRRCMTKERQNPVKYMPERLKKFRKLRDCSGIHSHEGTSAKKWLVHPNTVIRCARKETYICSFTNK